MKRANSIALAATTLILSSTVVAKENEPQTCAEAAFEVTGETRYEVVSAQPLGTFHHWHKLTLEAEQSGSEVVCKIRQGKITALEVDLAEKSNS